VRESLDLSCHLRLPTNLPQDERAKFVENILNLLELDIIQQQFVGEVGQGGLSFEQRKRLTLGVELVANPSVLFLDEPTSGLDARAAQIVMRAIKNVVSTGRTVICTIHQPSASLFSLFDNLLLLKRGGQTVFFGPLGEDCSNLISYFSAIPNTPEIQPGMNPATWMLECIGAGTTQSVGSAIDYAAQYQASSLCHQNTIELGNLVIPEESSNPISFKTKYASTLWSQFRILIRQAAIRYWRSPNYNLQRLCVSTVVGVLFGSVFANSEGFGEQTAIISSIGLMFLTTVFVGVVYFNGAIPMLSKERAVYYREQASNAYRPFPYALAWGLAEIPYLLVCTLVFISIFYFLVGFEAVAWKFFYYYLFFFQYTSFMTFLGQLFAAILPNGQTAQVVGSAITSLFTLFGGFLIPAHKIPDGWIFLHYINPLHYAFEGLVVTQYHGASSAVQILDTSTGNVAPSTAEQVALNFFGGEFSWSNRHMDFAILLAFTIFIRFGTFMALKFIRHVKR